MSENGQRRVNEGGWIGWVGWVAIGLIVSWSLTVAGGVWAVASDRQVLMNRTTTHDQQIADHEQRIRVIEAQLQRIATDVRWIRTHLERSSDE